MSMKKAHELAVAAAKKAAKIAYLKTMKKCAQDVAPELDSWATYDQSTMSWRRLSEDEKQDVWANWMVAGDADAGVKGWAAKNQMAVKKIASKSSRMSKTAARLAKRYGQ